LPPTRDFRSRQSLSSGFILGKAPFVQRAVHKFAQGFCGNAGDRVPARMQLQRWMTADVQVATTQAQVQAPVVR
jgi:hypothetical protein